MRYTISFWKVGGASTPGDRSSGDLIEIPGRSKSPLRNLNFNWPKFYTPRRRSASICIVALRFTTNIANSMQLPWKYNIA